MTAKNEKAEATELVTIAGETLPAPAQLKPQHYEALDGILTNLYQYQYRHVKPVSFVKLGVWTVMAYALCLIDCAYIQSQSWTDTLKSLLSLSFILAFSTGFLSVFARCLTRLFQFKACALRMCQILVVSVLAGPILRQLMYFTHYSLGFEKVLQVSTFFLLAGMFYASIDSLVLSKWVKLVRVVYAVLFVVIFSASLYFERVRHYVFEDNQIEVYSDYGARAAKPLDTLDTLIDTAAKAFE